MTVQLGPLALGSMALAAAALVGLGLALTVVGVLTGIRRRGESLAELLDLVGGERDVPVEAVTETPAAPQLSRVTARLGDALDRLDKRGFLERALARAAIPLRPGEYLFLAGAAVLVSGLLAGALSANALVGAGVAAAVGIGARAYLTRRGRRRRDQMRAQLPDAFSLIASSVASGHTVLRSIQLLREEMDGPLAGELDRAVAEVALGSNLVDALDRMAVRVEIDDLRWAVQAVRIQQTTGGQLAEILRTLADLMRAREDVHREVRVLSAEGRFSAYVLMVLPFFVALCMEVVSPSYLRPLFRGWGLAWLALCAAMLAAGYVVIRRLVDVEV